MEAIFCVLRTGCQWNALHETDICASRSAHRRVQEWTEAGVCLGLWTSGLVAYEAWTGMAWEGLALDGAMTNAPRGGENGGPASDRARADRGQAPRPHRRRWRAPRPRGGGSQAA
jgi:putative transposase